MWHVGRRRTIYYLRNYRNTVLCGARRGVAEVSCAPTLDEVVGKRRQQAQRSLLVEVAGAASAGELHFVCSQYGAVEAMFHYTAQSSRNTGPKEIILVEFKDPSAVTRALKDTSHPAIRDCPPTYSPMVWLAAKGKAEKGRRTPREDLLTHTSLTEEELAVKIAQCSTVSEQIQALHDGQTLTELGWRLRFFTCRQVEGALSGMFPQAVVLPFGSSVNAFGRCNSDLDMTVELAGTSSQHKDLPSRFVFQAKRSTSQANPRLALQRKMEIVSEIMENFLPGCSQVRRILNARVPIIKYRQELTAIDCDLTMSNRSGYHMSQMLHLFGSSDSRVVPLVGALRRWARCRGLTSPHAGRWLTNFSLTLMVLTYLMNTKPPLLLPLTALRVTPDVDKESGDPVFLIPPESARVIASTATENQESLESLLMGFFEFYDRFNFRERGMSILSGKDFIKPAHCALYIQNPLELDLNVSRNVTLEEVERLKTEITHARYILEGEAGAGDSSTIWGAQHLWTRSGTAGVLHHSDGTHTIDWRAVFHQDSDKKHKNNNSRGQGKGASQNAGVLDGTRGPHELPGLVSKLKQKAQQKAQQKMNQHHSRYKGKLR